MIRTALIALTSALVIASPLRAAADDDHDRKLEPPTVTVQNSGTTNSIRAVSPVNDRVVWAGATNGSFLKTTDGGKHWHVGVVPGAEAFEFRDVQGVSEDVAYLLSIGNTPDAFRIYKTEDGGEHWKIQFVNQIPTAFYDCFAFWTPKRGLTTSDSVNGRFPAILTRNGETWEDIGDRLPKAQPEEASFASSGTCVATEGKRRVWIATGGAAKARILRSIDGGDTWAAYDTPIVQGTSLSGVFSVDFRDAHHGILGAGDLGNPKKSADTVARSRDGGKTWHLGGRTPFPGAIYGLSYVRYSHLRSDDDADDDRDADHDADRDHRGDNQDAECRDRDHEDHDWEHHGRDRHDCDWFRHLVVATGPNGAAWSPDEGESWRSLPGLTNYWAVAFGTPEAGWIVGTNGEIAKISFEKPEHHDDGDE